MYIHHLTDGLEGVIHEHIDCLCLQLSWTDICCRNQKQTVKKVRCHLHPALFSYMQHPPRTHRQTYTHPAASCSVWRETHLKKKTKKRKRQEWPHLYVHSVCTVSSETPVIVKLQLWQCWERKINEYMTYGTHVLFLLCSVFLTEHWVSCQCESKEN